MVPSERLIGSANPPVAISPEFAALLFKSGVLPEILTAHTPPLGDRLVSIYNNKDLTNLVEIENRVRRGADLPNPATGPTAVDRHEAEHLQLTQRFEQLLTDGQKKSSKNSKRNPRHDSGKSETPDSQTEGQTDRRDKKNANEQGTYTYRCWLCDTNHGKFCDQLDKNVAKSETSFKQWLAHKYELSADQIEKVKMPTSMAELKKLYFDLKPSKKKDQGSKPWQSKK